MSGAHGGQGAAASKTNAKIIGLAVAAALGGFLFGFDSSVINGAVGAIEAEFELTQVVTGFAVASALIGCAVGAYLGGRLADRIGRTRAMLVAAILFLASAIGSAFAIGVIDLIGWRILGGIGVGLASVLAPAYISEISPKHARGRLASLQQLAITIGIFAALLSDQLFAEAAGGAGEPGLFGLAAWRWMLLAEALPAIVYGILALRLPESPRYLLMRERHDEAKRVLASVSAGDAEVDTAIADIERGIRADAEAEAKGTVRGERFGLKPIVWVGIILSVLQQFVGINVIFYYSTTLWQSVGFAESDAFLVSTITSVTNILVTLIAIALVDRVGRRPILLTGSIGMVLSLGTMALAFSQAGVDDAGEPTLPGAWGPIALVAANVFVVAFGASWGPLVWVLLGEIFPNRIRARALGIGAMAQWIANFIVTTSFPPLAEFSLAFTYGMYAVMAALSFLFVLTKIPETNGVALEDTETLTVPTRRGRAESRR